MIKKILIAAGVILLALLAVFEFVIMQAPRQDYMLEQGLYRCRIEDPEYLNWENSIYITEDRIMLMTDKCYYDYENDRTEKIMITTYEYSCMTGIHLLGNLYFRDDDVASLRYYPDGTAPLLLSCSLSEYAEYYLYDDHYHANRNVDSPGKYVPLRIVVKYGESLEFEDNIYIREQSEDEFFSHLEYLDSLES